MSSRQVRRLTCPAVPTAIASSWLIVAIPIDWLLDAKQGLWRTKVRSTRARRGRASATKAGAKIGATPTQGGFLFNQAALATVLRVKLLDATRGAGLSLPPRLPADWVAHCKAVGDGQKALLYLSRYLYRGVIREADIQRCDAQGNVSFQYRDAKTGKMAQRTLPGADFLWHVLQQVLPRGLQRSRNFGFLHPNSAGAIRLLQVLHLRVPPCRQAGPAPERPAWRCACGQPMHVVRRRMPALQDANGPNLTPLQEKPPDKPNAEQGHTMQ